MMAEPVVFDARNGLPPEALRGLKRANGVTLGLKDKQTAVLGYWEETPGPGGQSEEQLVAILIRNSFAGYGDFSRQPLVHVADALRNKGWRRILRLLQPGDILDVGRFIMHPMPGERAPIEVGTAPRARVFAWSPERTVVSLGITGRDGFAASLRLPPAPASGLRRRAV